MTISQTQLDRLPDELKVIEDEHGVIVRIDEERRTEAINGLLAVNGRVDHARSQRFIAYSRANSVRLDSMWARLDDEGRIMQTVLAVPNPGCTAMIFATRPHRKQDVQPIAGLIDHACSMLVSDEVKLGQVLLDPADVLEREVFQGAGFTELARLSYMERPMPGKRKQKAVNWPDDVRIEPYRESLVGDLLAILDASYEDTLDCPGLRGLRETQDILAGHRSTGEFDPSLWTLLYVDNRPAGVLLLNPTPQHHSVELVYVGLATFARGRGLAKSLLHHGLALLAGRKERVVTLAVDDRNAPALSLYTKEGFRRVLRRIAMIRRTGVCEQPH